MDEIVEGQPARLDLLFRTCATAARASLPASDVVCRLKGSGTSSWREKKLDAVSWQDGEHGVYILTLDPGDLPDGDRVTLLVEGRPDVRPTIDPILRTFKVVPPRPRFVAGDLPRTSVVGRIMTLDCKPRVKAQLTFRIPQGPLAIGGIAVTGEQITAETDADGWFEVDLVTGASVAVQIQSINWNRIVVVPPAPAIGVPVKLFSI